MQKVKRENFDPETIRKCEKEAEEWISGRESRYINPERVKKLFVEARLAELMSDG